VSRRVRLALFLGGLALFLVVVRAAGGSELLVDARRTGWMIVPIVALYGLVHVLDAAAWHTILADEPARPAFRRTLATVVAGTAINYITPMVNAGGEPYKIAALAPWTGTSRATASVVLHTMVRTLGLLLLWLFAVGLGFVLLPYTVTWLLLLTAALFLVSALIVLLLAAHRGGVVARVIGWAGRVPGLRGLARRLDPHRDAILAMDRQIVAFYHQRPGRFRAAVAYEFLSRCVIALEFCLIGVSAGHAVGYLDAFVVSGLEGLVGNLLFIVPFELGTREGATLLLFQQLGYPTSLGLYAAVVGRARDLLWIAAGLLLIWAGGRRPVPASAPLESTTP